MTNSIKNIVVNDISGKPVSLSTFEGKVLLVVNVASKCGLTPQYEGLEKIYKNYKEQGFEVLGFPANEFLAQEPGTNSEIAEFCRGTFGIDFPMFEKIVVKGKGQHDLYKTLTNAIPTAEAEPNGNLRKLLGDNNLLFGEAHDITWNFEKFLINRKGEIVKRFDPDVSPESESLNKAIKEELAK